MGWNGVDADQGKVFGRDAGAEYLSIDLAVSRPVLEVDAMTSEG